MRHNIVFRYTKLGTLAAFSLLLNISCFAAPEKPIEELKLKWFGGLSLGQMLETEIASDSIDNLKKQLTTNWYDSFALYNPSTPTDKKSIKTCTEFFSSAESHLQPVDEKDALPYMELGMMCHAVKTVTMGKNAKRSYIGQFKMDKSIVDTFPPQLANIISTEERKRILSNKKITSLGKAEKVESIQIENDKKVTIKEQGGSQEIELLAQGDFNDDGIADLLFLVRNSVDEGTFGSVELFALTKRRDETSFELLKQYAVY